MYKRLIATACAFVILIFVLNTVASTFYWYTAIFGFDKVMHTLGGIALAFLVGAVSLKQIHGLSKRDTFITLVLATFIIGLGWEYYEYIVQFYIKTVHIADIPDSIGDLIFDTVGGCIGASFVIMMNSRYNKSQ